MDFSRLLDQMRKDLRLHHYHTHSEEVYSHQVIGARGAPYYN